MITLTVFKRNIPILAILALALIFRLYQLSQLSLFSDEVDAGYQSQTFLRCLTDYFGHHLPIHFQSFADWRTPGFIYSIIISFRLFGSSAFALRLPSVLASLFTLYFLYLLLQKLFKNSRFSLFLTLLFSFNPWFFHYSRIGFEASLMLSLLLPGLYFLLQKKHFLSLIFFALSLYSYNTTRLFVPLFFLPHLKTILKLKKGQLFILALICFPLVFDMFRHPINQRFGYINIFTDPTNKTQAVQQQNQFFQEYLTQNGHPPNMFILRTYYSQPVYLARIFLSRYLESFSPNFLFFQSDLNLRHGFSGKHGYFYLIDIPLILLGLFWILKFRPQFAKLLFWGLILSAIPNSITRDGAGPHGTRLSLMLPFLLLILASAFHFLFHKFRLIFYLTIPVYIFSIFQFLLYYYQIYPQQSYLAWHSNLKPVLEETFRLEKDYSQIIYSSHPEPFIPFFAYFKPYPNSCSPLASLYYFKDSDGFTGWQLESRYFFGKVDIPKLLYDLKQPTLLVISDEEPHSELKTPPLYHQHGYSIFALKAK